MRRTLIADVQPFYTCLYANVRCTLAGIEQMHDETLTISTNLMKTGSMVDTIVKSLIAYSFSAELSQTDKGIYIYNAGYTCSNKMEQIFVLCVGEHALLLLLACTHFIYICINDPLSWGLG